jgi:hypothetical protein
LRRIRPIGLSKPIATPNEQNIYIYRGKRIVMKIIAFIAAVVIIIIFAMHLSPGGSGGPGPYLGPGTGPEMPKIHSIVDAP